VTFTPPVRVERSRDTPVERGRWASRLRSRRTAIDLLSLEPHERAAAGLFLGFQYPVEIPGVSNVQFLREALNAQRKHRGEDSADRAANS
jgi:Fe-S cluster assembly ATPase SufC